MLYITIILLVLLFLLFKKLYRTDIKNCFVKMNCTGKPTTAPLTKEEMHNVLRNSFHPEKCDGVWDAIIIGSGLSGLTIAKILAASNWRVLVLEQHDRIGGSCHTFDLDGYEFDVGLHYVQDMYPGKTLFHICSALTESQAQWQKIEDPFDVVIIGEKKYGRMTGDMESLCLQLQQWFPKEYDNIQSYYKYTKECMKRTRYFFAVKSIPAWIIRMMFTIGIAKLLAYFFLPRDESLLQSMQRFGLSRDCQAMISYYFLNYGVPPNRSSFFLHSLFLMPNAYYPIGGAGMITSHAVDSIKKLGGELLVKADVKRICFADGKVNGVLVKYGHTDCFVQASRVISTASIMKTFNKIIPSNIACQSAIYTIANKVQSLESVKIGAFQAYIGFNTTQDDLKLPSNDYFWFRNNNPFELDEYVSLSLTDALNYGCPPILFICFPSAKDPSWKERHPGTSTCQLITMVNADWFNAYKDTSKEKSLKRINAEEYNQLKNDIGEKMVDQMLRFFPEIKSYIAYVQFSSPLSQQYYMQNCYGEMYSLSHVLDRFRLENWNEMRCTTGIPGLYLSGQDVLFCGISSALISGFMTAGTILQRDLFKDLKDAYLAQCPSEVGNVTKILDW